MDGAARERFLKKLGNYYARILMDARWVAFTFGGRGDDDETLARRARELVHEVAFRVLEERRKWVEEIDFRVFMKLQMKSVAFNEWKQLKRLDSLDEHLKTEDGSEPPKKELATEPTPLDTALSEQEAEERVYELLLAAEGDDTLTKVIEAYLEDDCERPRHVASRLGILEKDVYQAQRKLERRVMARRKKVNS